MKPSWLVAAALIASSVADAAPLYQPAVQVGTVASSSITEASGLAASRRNPGVLWTHNDSGDSARIFAMAISGTLLGTYQLTGVTASDFEDIAVGPGPDVGTSYVYVGDIGDNDSVKPSIHIHRIAEPLVNLSGGPVSTNLAVETFTLQYPNGPHNAETLMIDPLNSDLYVVTKENSIAHVFRAAFPQSKTSTITLEAVTTLSGIDKATGGDISPGGDAIVIRNQSSAWQWSRPVGGTVADALALPSQSITLHSESQGEALGFSFGTTPGFFTTSENLHQPIYFYATVPEPTCVLAAALTGMVLLSRQRQYNRRHG